MLLGVAKYVLGAPKEVVMELLPKIELKRKTVSIPVRNLQGDPFV
jgi:hypothetical protein